MTTPKDIFDNGALDIFTSCADPGAATFNPAVGASVSCLVDIRFDVQFSSAGTDTEVWSQATVLEYLISQVGREVNIGETFTVGAITYTVTEILTNDGRFAKAVVK